MSKDTSQKPQILTFGCRLNRYESEVMGQYADGLGDVVVVNTCAVTAEAERQARQAIRRLNRKDDQKRIVVTGCAAQLNPEKWSSLPGVVQVLGNEDKLQAENWTNEAIASGNQVSDIMSVKKTAAQVVTEFTGRTRAFVQVQQGCDHRCTFCVIPFGRGPSRSVTIEGVINQARTLVEQDYKEVVLTGVDIASWGSDFEGDLALGDLCKAVLKAVPDLERLRLSSIDPIGFDNTLWELLKTEPRLMPHLHLSVQAGSDMILKRMKRRHLTEDVDQLVQRLRSIRSDIGLSVDIIAGFPTEDDTYFQETYEFLKQQAFPYLHVFPYSERKGTPAAQMPAVSVAVRKERAAKLRELGQESARLFHESLIGKDVNILMETPDRGHSEQFAFAVLQGEAAKPGEMICARVVSGNVDGIIVERI
ncbi:tRNA (N(6)-L-threonylcarbamoyladenosine(37)-C(2))-methylthiotransferase MtaB [Commensalibacter papalotli (ex Servin-Garciduenas et al. 2014)]|uniref:tRNA 2-methylthioadenosine synthase MiaB n=1 Tax=Commensalibacter papalotli (ex Servin-Garciduenas et al. 2014) TaxID=1208583 RepID=W7DY97_9PROT|nr:tRNA (N(6)-L-threonylcarbamoyladenosine(37)-C(2))-methylthiotransferase MtaB [Commensalibacter papalotli (ex Servin-Garciduenas et al. 2014)]EUK17614.1 tRNA 2-methylthioadenosine synthase MiaB [Commensalibacter papalotli (ex Servin-Garciduenas et al. 2014)]